MTSSDLAAQKREHEQALRLDPTVDAWAKDAERYRWLRDHSARASHHTPTVFSHGCGGDIIDGGALDAAIDKARCEPK